MHPVSYVLKRPLLIHGKAYQPGELMHRVYTLLETVGLNPPTEFAKKFPHELSGGQRQRVAIARALAVDPEVILADEPISMLDVSIRMGVLNLMEALKIEHGIGYLYITHDIASARYIADGILVMYAGYMVEGGDSEAIIREPAHPYTQLLLSAVPNPSAGLTRQRAASRPEAPFAERGCPFASRCPQVMDICRQQMPGAEHLAANHWVRCHLYGPGSDGDEDGSVVQRQKKPSPLSEGEGESNYMRRRTHYSGSPSPEGEGLREGAKQGWHQVGVRAEPLFITFR